MCGTPSPIKHALSVHTGIYPQDKVIYSCFDGFLPDPLGDDLIRKCLDSGEWSGPTPNCIGESVKFSILAMSLLHESLNFTDKTNSLSHHC